MARGISVKITKGKVTGDCVYYIPLYDSLCQGTTHSGVSYQRSV